MNYTKEKTQQLYEAGEKVKFLFFWGHQPHPSGETTASCFSQWWESEFVVEGISYPTAEHWMMAEKARLFNDETVLKKIIAANSPGEAKKLGRQVSGFDQKVWEEHRFGIVVKGNHYKFSQHEALKKFLLNTKNRVLVEASPVDPVWGIGLSADSEAASVPMNWRGLNLLGFALMEVRDLLKP